MLCMLQSLARFCFRRRWLVLVSWIVLLIACFAISGAFGADFRTEFSLPGSESQEAADLLEASGFGDRAGIQGQIVFQAEQGVNDPEVQAAMEQLFAEVAETVPDSTVVSPYSPEGARQISQDGTIAYAEVNLAERPIEEYLDAADQVKAAREQVAVSGLTVELGGDIFAEQSEPASEVIGIIAAIVILLIAFGSLLAMGLPIVTALFGVGSGVALIGMVAHGLAVPDFAPAVAAMIGIGAGIDYALFIVTRYRQGLDDGLEPEDAVALAINTAGRAVIFAGLTVIISVMGLLFMELDTFRSISAAAGCWASCASASTSGGCRSSSMAKRPRATRSGIAGAG
jgi:RND superfamily putative drug exporter